MDERATVTDPSAQPAFCRVCHNMCAVLVDVDGRGRVTHVTGDPAGPLHGGYSCIKGRNVPEFMYGDERLWWSQARQPDGGLRPVSSLDAVDRVAETIAGLVRDHGPR